MRKEHCVHGRRCYRKRVSVGKYLGGRPGTPVEKRRSLGTGIASERVVLAPEADLEELLAECVFQRLTNEALLRLQATPPERGIQPAIANGSFVHGANCE